MKDKDKDDAVEYMHGRILGMPDPKIPKTVTSCPVWFTSGPHSWCTGVPGVYSNVCSNCGATRKDVRRPKVKLKLIQGGKA
jgi:hypothetical protein